MGESYDDCMCAWLYVRVCDCGCVTVCGCDLCEGVDTQYDMHVMIMYPLKVAYSERERAAANDNPLREPLTSVTTIW